MTQQREEQPDDTINTGDYSIYWKAWKAQFGDDTEGTTKTERGWDLLVYRMTPAQFHKIRKSWEGSTDEWIGLNEALKLAAPDNPLRPWAEQRLERVDREIAFCEAKMLIPGARK